MFVSCFGHHFIVGSIVAHKQILKDSKQIKDLSKKKKIVAKFILVKENRSRKISYNAIGKKVTLQAHEEGEKCVFLRRIVLVVVEKCCLEKGSLVHIVGAGKNGWSWN